MIETWQVSLSIGIFYQELVDCDVLDMDSCHVLLERPLQYNKDTNNKGKYDTYYFVWQGKTIVLVPQQENSMVQTSKSHSVPLMLNIGGYEVIKEVSLLPMLF